MGLNAIANGSFHQGDLQIFPPMSAGRQCVANCIMAVIYSFVLPVEQWQTEHLDCILITGNNLYQTIKSPDDYLLVSDIPNFIAEFGGYYKVP